MGELGLRLIKASRLLERIYNRFDRWRSIAILGLADDDTLDRFNDMAYRTAERYQPELPGYVGGLYPWEEQVIARYFPPPPATVLVGGAGAGREPLALARQGYLVTAFEPVKRLALSMASAGGDHAVKGYVGDYRRLPMVAGVEDGLPASLEDEAPFDAAIIGWGSFSHLRTESARIGALAAMGKLTRGPILISFISTRPDGAVDAGRARRWLLERRDRHPADRFSMSMGFHHPVSKEEVAELVQQAGLKPLEIDFSGSALAPHAVLSSG